MNFKFLYLISFFFTCCATQQEEKIQHHLSEIEVHSAGPTERITRMTFDTMKALYDTLIPTFDGLFITYSNQDTASYFKILNTIPNDNQVRTSHGQFIGLGTFGMNLSPAHKKWGSIDSTGRIVVPFVCDGICQISEHEGLFVIGTHVQNLNTGLPRYYYEGQCFHFDKNGQIPTVPEKISYRIVFGHNNYRDQDHLINQGPNFYLPERYVKYTKTSSGQHEVY
jgi:hypothetical protein